jgi:excisionase family DNA binding protein
MATDSVGTDVFTLKEAAAFLRVSTEAVLRAVSEQGLEAREMDGEWRFLKSEIEDWLRHRSPKARMLATAGALKDDPYKDELLKNIYAERERQRDEAL